MHLSSTLLWPLTLHSPSLCWPPPFTLFRFRWLPPTSLFLSNTSHRTHLLHRAKHWVWRGLDPWVLLPHKSITVTSHSSLETGSPTQSPLRNEDHGTCSIFSLPWQAIKRLTNHMHSLLPTHQSSLLGFRHDLGIYASFSMITSTGPPAFRLDCRF